MLCTEMQRSNCSELKVAYLSNSGEIAISSDDDSETRSVLLSFSKIRGFVESL